MIRTDLVIESFDAQTIDKNGGIEQYREQVGNVTVTRVKVTDEKGERRTGKPKGDYVTMEVPPLGSYFGLDDRETERMAWELEQLLPKEGDVLVVGLGNSSITPDAVGPLTCEKVLATRHLPEELQREVGLGKLRGVAVLAPGVLGQTGMETAEILGSICQRIRPCCVIAIDALAARDACRLGSTVQISNTGIAPGSGVGNRRCSVSAQVCGVPVIGVGIPTVIDLRTVIHGMKGGNGEWEQEGRSLVVTPQDVDLMVAHGAGLLSMMINKALQPHMSLQDISALL